MALKFSVAMQGSYPIRDYIDKAQRIEPTALTKCTCTTI